MENNSNTHTLDEWELSKENVLPLKQGRKMTNLTAALQPLNVDRQQQLNLQRQGFETELRAYTGDDPLEPWIRYIQWTEQNFPQGGKDSHLSILIQKCLIQFKTDEHYKQDVRFVSIWLKMAQYDNESLEIFKFMQANKIGTKVALFYETWAWELEQVGNTKRADAVYKEGLACNAEPRDKLEKALIEFQSRVGRNTMQQLQEGMMNPQASEDQRATLGDLRARGKQQRVGTSRTGTAKLSSRGGLQVSSAPLQQVGNQISIFRDDDASAARQPEAPSEWKHLPSRTEAQKENTRSAGQWAGQRLPQRNVPKMSFQEVSAFNRPDFAVHVDDNAHEMTTPRKPVSEMGCHVLSEKKVSKPAHVLQHIKQDNVQDNTQVMYCKHLIYGGAREMSFEELRAIKDKKKREERKLQTQMTAIQELLKKQSEQQEMLQQKLAQQELQNQQLLDLLAKQKQDEAAAAQHVPPSAPVPVQTAPHPIQTAPGLVQTAPQPIQTAPQPVQNAPVQVETAPVGIPTRPVAPTSAPQPHPASLLQMPVATVMPSSSAPEQPKVREDEPKVVVREDPATDVQYDSILDGNVTKSRHRSHSGDTTGCTKQLAFDDVTGATGNFNIFCDQAENKPITARQPASNIGPRPAPNSSAFQPSAPEPSTQKPPSGVPLNAGIKPTSEQEYITPNQSLNMNGSMGNISANTGDNKTPSTESFTVSSTHRSGTRMGRLSQIRTPKGLTAPSPTINTKEAMGVINAMLNSSLETSILPWEEHQSSQIPAQDKDFEMEFANTDENDKPQQKGLIYEEQSAFTRVGGIGGGQGIVPMRQPLAIRPGVLSAHPPEPVAQPPPPPPPSTCSSSSGITVFQDDAVPMTKIGNENKFNIFEENPVEETKENTPPSDYRQAKEKREMMGILQASKGIPFAPLEEENPDAEGGMEVDPHDAQPPIDPLASSQHTMNHTLPPSATGNQSFGVAARMASTPFNSASQQKLSFIPPLSTIKPSPVQDVSEQDVGLALQRPIPILSDSRPSVPDGGDKKIGFATRTTQPVNESFEKTEYIVNHSGGPLSPIMETSAENARSSTSSSSSSSNSHASASSLGSSHHASAWHVSSTAPASAELAPAVPFGFNIYTDTVPGAASKPIQRPGLSISSSSSAFSVPVNKAPQSTQPSAASSAFNIHEDKAPQHEQHAAPSTAFSIHMDDVPQRAQPVSSGPGFSIHMDEAPPHSHSAKSAQGFNIHIDEDVAQGHPIQAAGDEEAMDYMSESLHNMSLGSQQCNVDLHQSLRGKRAELDLNLSQKNAVDLHKSRKLDSRKEVPDAETTTFLQKDDLPALEMSFIPDRTLHDVEAVEQELTTFGLGSASPDYSDPFNAGLQSLLLSQLPQPLTMRKGFYEHHKEMPVIMAERAITFGDEISVYNVIKKIGEGAFATIYLATSLDAHDITDFDSDVTKVVLKVQQPPCPWEYYIIKELHARLSRMPSQIDVRPCLMSAECAHVFMDHSCLVTEYSPNGTLLDLINKRKGDTQHDMPEEWVLHLTIEILQVVEFMHKCSIIHGDIKPDNFLIMTGYDANDVTCVQGPTNLLKLIDMGRSIDVSLFPAGTLFTSKCNTSGFNCVEMQTNRPWTYQVDYYGIAGTVHCMMFGKYMKVFQEGGVWKMTSSVNRKAKAPWKEFFHTLLNVKSCDPTDLPNLGELRKKLEKFVSKPKEDLQVQISFLLQE